MILPYSECGYDSEVADTTFSTPKMSQALEHDQSECPVPLPHDCIYDWIQLPSLISGTQARMWVIFQQVLKRKPFLPAGFVLQS